MSICSQYVYQKEGISTRIVAVSPGILRITRTRREQFLDLVSPAVVCPTDGEGILTSCDGGVSFAAGQLSVQIDDAFGTMQFLDRDGKLLLREPNRRACLLEEKPVYLNRFDPNAEVREERSIDGARAYAVPSETYQDRTAYECVQRFVFDEEEALYGLGSHEDGLGNLRGGYQVLYQQNMKAVVPVLISTKGWGLLFDMGCLMAFHDDASGSYLWADCADELDWYLFYGDGSYASLMTQYRLLTGAAPMLPKYALGYIQSKERYVDAQELLATAKEYRRRSIPLDMVVLDWMSWPDGQWGWKHFDPSRFPDPSGMIQALHEMNVKFMLSIWPSMQGEQNTDRAEMLEKGCMLGNRLIYNSFDANARILYWKQTNENLFSHGVDAWWCDCSEPFESDWHGEIKPEPTLRTLLNTEEAKRYLDPAKIGLYSLYHSQGIYEGQRGVTKEKRVCNLTRSSWAGQHRYATITWSGDVSANWDTLRRHVPEGLNFCATGEPYWSTDIGAFFVAGRSGPWFLDGDFEKGVDDLGYRELYVRWAQYAAFLPMMRSHGTGTPREIWQFGEAGSPFYDALSSVLRLRYHLVPYLYSLMAQTWAAGIPMLRVPALVFPEDKQLRRLNTQMMLGDFLLLRPVTHPMYYLPDSTKISPVNDSVTVYLPEGHRWYHLRTGESFPGGQNIDVHAPLDHIPLFARSGSILPWAGEVQSTNQLSNTPLKLIVFPGEDGSFLLYDDAGDGYGYEENQHAVIPMHWDDPSHVLTIGQREGDYPGMPEKLQLLVHLIGCAVTQVEYTGQEVQIRLQA